MSLFLRLICLFSVLLLGACVESEEEISINLSGSGSLKTTYHLPLLAKSKIGDPERFVQALHDIDSTEDGFSITKLSFQEEGTQLVFRLEADFDSAGELGEIIKRREGRLLELAGVSPDVSSDSESGVETHMEGLGIYFERTIALSGALPSMVKAMPSLLGSSTSKFTIHLPVAVKTSNAHNISENGRTLTWVFKLQDHVETPIKMTFLTKTPIPWWGWALGILLLYYLVKRIFRSRKKRRRKNLRVRQKRLTDASSQGSHNVG